MYTLQSEQLTSYQLGVDNAGDSNNKNTNSNTNALDFIGAREMQLHLSQLEESVIALTNRLIQLESVVVQRRMFPGSSASSETPVKNNIVPQQSVAKRARQLHTPDDQRR